MERGCPHVSLNISSESLVEIPLDSRKEMQLSRSSPSNLISSTVRFTTTSLRL